MDSTSVNLAKVTPKKLKSSDYEMGKTLGTGNNKLNSLKPNHIRFFR
jgi:uncharacterized protein YhfF